MPNGCNDDELPWNRTGEWLDTKYPYGRMFIWPASLCLQNLIVFYSIFLVVFYKCAYDSSGLVCWSTDLSIWGSVGETMLQEKEKLHWS